MLDVEGKGDGDGDDGHVDGEAKVGEEGWDFFESTDGGQIRRERGEGGWDGLLSLAQWSRASLLSFSKSKGPRGGHEKKADEPARVDLDEG